MCFVWSLGIADTAFFDIRVLIKYYTVSLYRKLFLRFITQTKKLDSLLSFEWCCSVLSYSLDYCDTMPAS